MVYCVEDDQSIRDLMVYTLKSTGFDAKGFVKGEELFEALKEEIPDIIILDIMLPGMDGIEILKRIRADHRFYDIPVILATAKDSEYDKVRGLDLGADDYLAKPFGMMEMISRIKAVLRRTNKKSKDELQVGQLYMNISQHIVRNKDEELQLTLKEFDLLKILMENVGLVLSRNQLLELIWGDVFYGDTRTVDVHVATLRTKLKDCSKYIKTIRGIGYRMEAVE